MSTVPYEIATFSGGEWDPQLSAAINLAKYKTANKVMRNFFGAVNGMAHNRPGLRYVCATKNTTTSQSAVQNVKLIPFQFSTIQTYVLELGDLYMRVIKNGVLLGAPYVLITPYSQADVMGIGYTQSADTLFLAHPNYPPQIIQRISDTSWTITPYAFKGGPFMLDNTVSTYSVAASGFAMSASTSLIPIGTSVTLASSGFTPFVSGHVGSLWRLDHYVPNVNLGTSLGSATSTTSIVCGGTWRLVTNGIWTGTISVQKSLDGGATWLQLNSYTSADNFNANTFGTEDMSNNAPPFLVRVTCTAYTSGTITINLSSDPFIQSGIISVTSFQSSSSVLGVVQQTVGINNKYTSNWAEGEWSTYRGWPTVVEFTPDDRLMWANTPFHPQTSWLTKTSNYYDFNVSDPLVDSDSLNINLPSRQINGVNGLIPLRAMLALTTSGEWSIESSQGVSAPVTPSTAFQRVHGYEGSQGVRPVVIGIRGIFVQNLGKVIRDVGYELVYDSFVGANVSIFSNHLFQFDKIVDMCYCQNPDSLVWIVMASGEARALTYLREQQVVTFAPQDTMGKFMACCSIADTVNNYNPPYFVVNRANGQYIEYMPKRMATTFIQDQFFVDCGGVFDALGQTFQNPDFEKWTLGPNASPDGWTLAQSSTIAQTSGFVSSATKLTNVESGLYSAKLQGSMYQQMQQAYGFSYWRGRSVTFSAWVKCSTASSARVSINDGIGTTYSSYHTGGGTWEALTVTRIIDASATKVQAQCHSSAIAYFDNTYFNSGVSQITGATWLNGQTISILADGFVLDQQVVSNGIIELGAEYNKISYGLPYNADLQPVNPQIETPSGTMQGRTINIGKTVLKLWNSAGGMVGIDFNKLTDIPDTNITNYDSPVPLFTGSVNCLPGGGFQTDNSICIRQSDPLPLSVLAIISEIGIGGIPAVQ